MHGAIRRKGKVKTVPRSSQPVKCNEATPADNSTLEQPAVLFMAHDAL